MHSSAFLSSNEDTVDQCEKHIFDNLEYDELMHQYIYQLKALKNTFSAHLQDVVKTVGSFLLWYLKHTQSDRSINSHTSISVSHDPIGLICCCNKYNLSTFQAPSCLRNAKLIIHTLDLRQSIYKHITLPQHCSVYQSHIIAEGNKLYSAYASPRKHVCNSTTFNTVYLKNNNIF